MSLRSAIPIVLNRFDFGKVQKVMTFLNWRWMGDPQSPTEQELIDCATSMLYSCVRLFEEQGCPASGMFCATGGLQAVIHTYPKGKPKLELLFYVDQSESFGEY